MNAAKRIVNDINKKNTASGISDCSESTVCNAIIE